MMTLRRKILVKDGLLLASLAVLIGGAAIGLWQQHRHLNASLNEYAILSLVQQGRARVEGFRQAVHSGKLSDPATLNELVAGQTVLSRYKAVLSQYDSILPPEIPADQQNIAFSTTGRIVTALVQLRHQFEGLPAAKRTGIDVPALNQSIDQVVLDIDSLSETCDGFIHRTQLESNRDLTAVMFVTAISAAAVIAMTIGASFWQYRKLIVPLQHLRAWCGRIAKGDLSSGTLPGKDLEFQQLSAAVNKMAAELDLFHRRLEAMVESKSRELVRSERLASVGYLAAGIAHEINTPLNIISGYAELSMKRLAKNPPSAPDDPGLTEQLNIIRSEAFRCKQITQRVLSLARGNSEIREEISLAQAVVDVAEMVRGLKIFRRRQLEVKLPADDQLAVIANLTEMKQVLLNLLVNAIEAVAQDAGCVVIDAKRREDTVEIRVRDNGRGMTALELGRIFEPFYTSKRGVGAPGTGLGLSITHTIVTGHGGSIEAHSDGPGLGSEFVLRLPAVRSSRLVVPPPAEVSA
jgi:signal transduction histidine kinase